MATPEANKAPASLRLNQMIRMSKQQQIDLSEKIVVENLDDGWVLQHL